MAIDKSKFLVAFKAETKDHLEKLTKGILDLEKNPQNVELLDTLMKEAHTVKGSASMMGFRLIADIAHKMEDGFEQAPHLDTRISQEGYDLLFECLDTIESLLEGALVRKARALDEAYVSGLCDRVLGAFGETSDQVEVATSVSIKDIPSVTGAIERQPPHAETAVPPGDGIQMRAQLSADPSGERKTPSDSASGKLPTGTAVGKTDPLASSTEESIRVDVGKLNRLMNLSGEMLIAKIRLNDLIKRLVEKTEQSGQLNEEFGDLIRQLEAADESISMVVSDVQEEALSLRMVPVAHLFGTFSRSVRDLAQLHGKDIELVVKGEDTFLDKNIIDRLKGPMIHLLRNCIDHGIEDPDTRVRQGKSKQGQILLTAYRAGSQVVLEVSDDGRGVDCENIRAQALEKGLLTPAAAQHLVDEQIYQLLFTSGFSTRPVVTATSGRGVGLDVVRDEISHLKGTIEVTSELGQGTSFVMKLPLTLSIMDALLVGCGDDIFSIPLDAIVETTRIGLDQIENVEGHKVMRLRGQIVPLLRIHDLFALPRKGIIEKRYFPVVIVQSAEKKLGLLVDEIMGHQEIVVKPLGDPMGNLHNIAGGTVLGNGRVVLILDVGSIIENAGAAGGPRSARRQARVPSRDHAEKRILLAEDVPSTALLETSVLEEAGFCVTHAIDGAEAARMALLDQYDLVVSDVLMPRMNGFELTAHLRATRQYKKTPIVIVTTRGSEADRKRGLQAGADAYVLKQDFTSDSFLETIDRLLSQGITQ